jgi:hypothetical protein
MNNSHTPCADAEAASAFTEWHNERKSKGLPGLADRDGFIAGYLARAATPAGKPLQRYFNSEFGVEKLSAVQHKNMPHIPTYYLASDVDARIAAGAPAETQAAIDDAAYWGTGLIINGKHVPYADTLARPASGAPAETPKPGLPRCDDGGICGAGGYCITCPNSEWAAQAAPVQPAAENAWDALRADVLHGIDGLDNDQTNSVLSLIDHYMPATGADGQDAKRYRLLNDLGATFYLNGVRHHVCESAMDQVLDAALAPANSEKPL